MPWCTSVHRVHLSAQYHLPDLFGDAIWLARQLGPVITLELGFSQVYLPHEDSSTYGIVYRRMNADTPCRSPVREGSIKGKSLKVIGTEVIIVD